MAKTAISSPEQIRAAVREHYAAAARAALERAAADSGCCGGVPVSPLAIADYDSAALRELPQEAVLASLGCGNPTALAALAPGEVVLDLGSGGGIDVLLSAKRVGPTGFAYGLDMTDEMLELAERNRIEAGVENARFLKGHIEEIPLPDASVDVVISNCVINLSADKDRVLREAWRVLRPGGRFAVSDIVVRGRLLPAVRRSLSAWSACIGGALTEDEYREKLAAAGFVDIGIEATRVLTFDDLLGGCCGADAGPLAAPAELQAKHGPIVSAFVRSAG
ncbi:MAG: arsenite methyltransferase [Sphaerobacter sp.]|nr:arsenite methyltransferase [Sphaerobacter sp.]